MFICIDQKTGRHTEGFATFDEAQAKLAELHKEARLKNKICMMTVIEVDDNEELEDDAFVIY